MKRNRHGASFTLIEVLVSMAVFSLLMLLIFSIMKDSTELWRQQSSADGSFREARAALNTLSRDMSAALVSTNAAWFYSNGTNELAFLTTLPDSAQGSSVNHGDICAVGYSLEWGTNDASGVQTNMSLYRYIRFSDPTYATNIVQGLPVEDIFSNPDGVCTVRELIARNISQVSFTTYTNDATGVPWISNQGFLSNMMINVVVTALNDRTAAILTSRSQWMDTNSTIVKQNQESFVLRVRPQGP